MKASQRLKVVERVADEQERSQARQLAASEQRLTQAEAKLAELKGYYANYARELQQLASGGMGASRLKDFQAFLGRLDEAVRLQAEILARARSERDADRRLWQQAAQRAEMVGKVVERRVGEEQRAVARQEQRDSDQRAVESSARRVNAHRN